MGILTRNKKPKKPITQKFTFFSFMLALILVPIGIPLQITGLILTRVISGFRFAFYYFTIMQIVNVPTTYNFILTTLITAASKYAPQLLTPNNFIIFQFVSLSLILWNFGWQFILFNTLTMFMFNHFPSTKYKLIKQALNTISRKYN